MGQYDLKDIILCISEPKLIGKTGENCSESKLLERYTIAIKQSQKLYPAFHILEVILRNKIHLAVEEIFGVSDWLIEYNKSNQKLIKAFSSLKKESFIDFKKQVNSAYYEATKKINGTSRSMIEGDLIAGLTFGFWTTLMGRPFSNILGDKGLFIKVFSNFKFSTIGTKKFNQEEASIRYKINEIRKERNRIFHHEKIHHFERTEEIIWETIRIISDSSYLYFKNEF